MELLAQSVPEVEAVAISHTNGELYYVVGEDNNEKGFKFETIMVNSDFGKVFNFDIISGSSDAIKEPKTFLISESDAVRMFGTSDAAGKIMTLVMNGVSSGRVVGGVYRDFTDNSSLKNVVYANMGDYANGQWGMQNFVSYIKMKSSVSPDPIIDRFLESESIKKEYPDKEVIRISPMSELYYRPMVFKDGTKTGDKMTTNILIAVAFLVIIIASINFINFSIALAPMRIKSINIKKVLGATDKQLRRVLMSESIIISIVAFLLSIIELYLINEVGLNSIFIVPLSLVNNIDVVLIVLLMSLAVGVISGLYPAYYMMLGIAFIIAIPTSAWFIIKYTEDFVLRAPLGWWIFASAIVVTLLISLLTVIWQTRRAATENPARALTTNN